MSAEISYYRSPLGIISIKSETENITEILFINLYKGVKIKEDEIVFSLPLSSVLWLCHPLAREVVGLIRSIRPESIEGPHGPVPAPREHGRVDPLAAFGGAEEEHADQSGEQAPIQPALPVVVGGGVRPQA